MQYDFFGIFCYFPTKTNMFCPMSLIKTNNLGIHFKVKKNMTLKIFHKSFWRLGQKLLYYHQILQKIGNLQLFRLA